MTRFEPITPQGLVQLCTERCAALDGIAVVGVDGAPAAGTEVLASEIVDGLRARGRAAAVVRTSDYLRPASLRLEYGRSDPQSYRESWFDFAAIGREVIDAVRTHRRWLPRLWDPVRDRSFRDEHRHATDSQIIVLAGPMLRTQALDLDLVIHLAMSEGALRRRTPDAEQWTIEPLLDDDAHAPTADLEVRYDHPERPALARTN